MPRYVDADKIFEYPIRINHYDKEHGNKNFVLGIESVMEYVEYLVEEESCDFKEINHGSWKAYPDCGVTRCSECDWSIEQAWFSEYCPNCGAKMDL